MPLTVVVLRVIIILPKRQADAGRRRGDTKAEYPVVFVMPLFLPTLHKMELASVRGCHAPALWAPGDGSKRLQGTALPAWRVKKTGQTALMGSDFSASHLRGGFFAPSARGAEVIPRQAERRAVPAARHACPPRNASVFVEQRAFSPPCNPSDPAPQRACTRRASCPRRRTSVRASTRAFLAH